MQKRPDIFCQALVLLGYIEEVESTKYKLTMALDKEKCHFMPNKELEVFLLTLYFSH